MRTLARILFFTSLFLGCAKARYADVPESNQGSTEAATKPNQVQAPCSAKLGISGYCVDWYWEVKPTAKTQGSLIFKTFRLNVFDQSAVAIDTITVPELILWMPGMGHGSTPTRVERLDVGTYRASQVFFVMPGQWELQFQVKSENKIIDQLNVAISI